MITISWFLTAFTKFDFGRVFARGPHWESLQRFPDPLAGLGGPTSKAEGKGGRGKRERRRGEEGNGRDPPPSQIPGSAPGA